MWEQFKQQLEQTTRNVCIDRGTGKAIKNIRNN